MLIRLSWLMLFHIAILSYGQKPKQYDQWCKAIDEAGGWFMDLCQQLFTDPAEKLGVGHKEDGTHFTTQQAVMSQNNFAQVVIDLVDNWLKGIGEGYANILQAVYCWQGYHRASVASMMAAEVGNSLRTQDGERILNVQHWSLVSAYGWADANQRLAAGIRWGTEGAWNNIVMPAADIWSDDFYGAAACRANPDCFDNMQKIRDHFQAYNHPPAPQPSLSTVGPSTTPASASTVGPSSAPATPATEAAAASEQQAAKGGIIQPSTKLSPSQPAMPPPPPILRPTAKAGPPHDDRDRQNTATYDDRDRQKKRPRDADVWERWERDDDHREPWAKPGATPHDWTDVLIEKGVDRKARQELFNLSQHSELGWMAANDLIYKLLTKDRQEFRSSPSAFVHVCTRNARERIEASFAKQGCPLYTNKG